MVGTFKALGSWEAAAAPAMTWREGHRWELDVTLPSTPFEFKVWGGCDSGKVWTQRKCGLGEFKVWCRGVRCDATREKEPASM